MRRLTYRIVISIITFVFGVGLSAIWIAGFSEDGQSRVKTLAPDEPETAANADKPVLEMVFVLDTTGSMGGLIDGAKQRVWGIVNEAMQAESRPAVRVGLVAYRDLGDQYVTQVLPLTDDLDKVYTTLMDYRAEGGGDGPENVRRALADGVHRAGWSQARKGGPNVAQILFLVGDAPPHDDYRNEPDTLRSTGEAIARGMVVNTIQCGEQTDTRRVWQAIAQRGEGRFFAIAQDGGVRSIETPYDGKLGELGTKLGGTYLAYGGGAGVAGENFRAEASAAQLTTETKVATAAPQTAQAERAMNKALNSNAYIGDLLQNVENGSVKLDAVKDVDLPDQLRKLPPAERQREVQRRLDERSKLRAEILALSKQREAFIAAEKKKRAGATQDSFDTAVASALKEQMARKGIK
ncbi:MAG TPA: vWA domain-containing protein [Pyrinomonadaceae bacterium]|jgi:Mg-chelatase subunit ChlD|nr:vWA domain-containing protein [Pyrinomonadaceae bacterium]